MDTPTCLYPWAYPYNRAGHTLWKGFYVQHLGSSYSYSHLGEKPNLGDRRLGHKKTGRQN